MMNRTYIYNWYRFIGILSFAAFIGLTGCSKMDDTYADFWKNGEIIYPSRADSVKIYPGKNRIGLTWLIKGDSRISKAKIYWNNKKDSAEIPIEVTNILDTVKVTVTDMAEGFYQFDIYHYDNRGNSSIKVSASGMVYGDNYISLLLRRSMEEALFANGSLRISWGLTIDETSIGDELVYRDHSGSTTHVYTEPNVDVTVLEDYDFNASNGLLIYRTMYQPDPMAIDMFYTAYDTLNVVVPSNP
ncbi:MAG: DUF4998 domain-containing protein [Mangrovibacterium sp.]